MKTSISIIVQNSFKLQQEMLEASTQLFHFRHFSASSHESSLNNIKWSDTRGNDSIETVEYSMASCDVASLIDWLLNLGKESLLVIMAINRKETKQKSTSVGLVIGKISTAVQLRCRFLKSALYWLMKVCLDVLSGKSFLVGYYFSEQILLIKRQEDILETNRLYRLSRQRRGWVFVA